jgi:hypothetical protein
MDGIFGIYDVFFVCDTDDFTFVRLAAKLHHYGVRGNTLSWIKSFLANRDQQVILDGAKFNSAPVSSGVPQGTVLGPLCL